LKTKKEIKKVFTQKKRMERAWHNAGRPPPLSKSYLVNLVYAPFGKDVTMLYVGEIVVNMLLEFIAVFAISFLSPPQGPVWIGLYVGTVICASRQLQYWDLLPRYLTPGAAVAAMLEGRISWFICFLYVAVGFVATTLAGMVRYATTVSFPNHVAADLPDLGRVVLIHLCFTVVIAFIRKRQGGTHLMNDIQYSNIIATVVAVFYHNWGTWAFSGYIHFADFIQLVMLKEHYTLNKIEFPTVRLLIPGIMYTFPLMDVLGHVIAMNVDVIVHRITSSSTRRDGDAKIKKK
jgi:hypothetical protein